MSNEITWLSIVSSTTPTGTTIERLMTKSKMLKDYITGKVDVNIEKNAFKIVNLKVAKEWNHYKCRVQG
jgi:hypothetical protein